MLDANTDRPLRLIGVASGLGGPAWAQAACAQGPAVLRTAAIEAAARRNGCDCAWDAILTPATGPTATVLPELLQTLAARVAACVMRGELPVVLGGDHSIAAGTWRGAAYAQQQLAPAGEFGLLWIDAHLDAHTPATSPSGNLHGMPLAALLGIEVPGLSLAGAPRLDARHLYLVGARSFEAAEMLLLRRLGVRIYDMEEINRRGLATVITEALRRLVAATAYFGVSIDLDAVDPTDAPGVSTPCSYGLSGTALCQALRGICHQPKLVALEIAEFNPAHDSDGRSARLAAALLEAATAHSGTPRCAREDRHGVLATATHGTVIHLPPPLTVADSELDQTVTAIAAAQSEVERELPRAA